MLVLLCVGGTVISALVSFILMNLFQLDLFSLTLALYPLLFVLVIPFVFIRSKLNYQKQIGRGIPVVRSKPSSFGSLQPLLFFPLLLLLTLFFNVVIEPVTMWLTMPDFIKELFGAVGNQGWISFFSLVIMAPLLEEWLCRGVALDAMLRRGYSPATAILWSAIMFGVIHLNPWQAIPAFLAGMLFGWIYWRTKSLLSVIFMHAITNGASLAVTLAFPNLPDEVTSLDILGPSLYGWFFAASLLITLSLLYLLHRSLPSREKYGKDDSTPPTIN